MNPITRIHDSSFDSDYCEVTIAQVPERGKLGGPDVPRVKLTVAYAGDGDGDARSIYLSPKDTIHLIEALALAGLKIAESEQAE